MCTSHPLAFNLLTSRRALNSASNFVWLTFSLIFFSRVHERTVLFWYICRASSLSRGKRSTIHCYLHNHRHLMMLWRWHLLYCVGYSPLPVWEHSFTFKKFKSEIILERTNATALILLYF